MRTVFLGTPEFAIPTLDALYRSRHSIDLVVTQPDRPRGRHLQLAPPPVKSQAEKLSLKVAQPDKLVDLADMLRLIVPQAVLVVAFGRFLPGWLLKLPPQGCINLHPSALPKYRGAAPIQRALMAGETETAVTTMILREGMDDGPVLLQRPVPIGEGDDFGRLSERLAEEGAKLTIETLDRLEDGGIKPSEQDHTLATFADKVDKMEAAIDWARPAQDLRNLVRALSPEPGAYTSYRGSRLKVFRVELRTLPRQGSAGEVIGVEERGVLVAAGSEALLLTEVQLEGKPRMLAADFLRGHQLRPGDQLESRRRH